MKCDKKDLILYAVTDRTWLGDMTLSAQVEEALKGGATFIQLREKELSEDDFLKEALNIKKICQKYNVPFIINDNLNVAIRSDADGIHIGQNDLDAMYVRNVIGKDKILGASVQTVEQAITAEKIGADYLGVGAIFATSSKADADNVSIATLKEICNAVHIPVVAIGGICADNILELKGSGVCGVAVISAIFASKNIMSATRRLKGLTKQVITND